VPLEFVVDERPIEEETCKNRGGGVSSRTGGIDIVKARPNQERKFCRRTGSRGNKKEGQGGTATVKFPVCVGRGKRTSGKTPVPKGKENEKGGGLRGKKLFPR